MRRFVLFLVCALAVASPAFAWTANTNFGDAIHIERDASDVGTQTVSIWYRATNPGTTAFNDGTWLTTGWTKQIDILCAPSVNVVEQVGQQPATYYKVTTSSGDALLIRPGNATLTVQLSGAGRSTAVPLYVTMAGVQPTSTVNIGTMPTVTPAATVGTQTVTFDSLSTLGLSRGFIAGLAGLSALFLGSVAAVAVFRRV